MSEKKIGIATEITEGISGGKWTPVTESLKPLKPVKGMLISILSADARFDCPSCGKGVSVHIEKKIKPTMTWSTEKPTVPGWYWWVRNNLQPIIVEVFMFNGKLTMQYPGSEKESVVDSSSVCSWCGPLEVPK